MKTILFSILGVILIEIIAVIAGVYSGIPDVAATKPEGSMMRWFLSTTKDHSIGARAKNITVPPLEDSALVAKGFDHYHELCVMCHGAPGKTPDEFAKGLNPHAPNLARSTRDMDPSEMFLVIKDGIKMTGMPGFTRPTAIRSCGRSWRFSNVFRQCHRKNTLHSRNRDPME